MQTERRYGGKPFATSVTRQTFLDWRAKAVAHHVARAVAELVRRHQHRQAVRRLSALSDRQLHDIGLSRADIAFAVRTGQRHRRQQTVRRL